MMSSLVRTLVTRFAPHRVESPAHRLAVRTLSFVERFGVKKRWDPARAEAQFDVGRLDLGSEQVMQDWERPLMHAMARTVAEKHGDVLELGFGLGISATEIQRVGCRSYTVVEANPAVQARIEGWRLEQPSPVTVVPGRWQEREPELDTFDGIFFDTHPASWAEQTDAFLLGSLAKLERHLRPGGTLVYFYRYYEGVPVEHQTVLCDLFESIVVRRVANLRPPPDCDYWRDDSMIFVACKKVS